MTQDGCWDNDALDAMARAALQAVPKLGSMEAAHKAVVAVVRSQSEYQKQHIPEEICQKRYQP